MALSIPSLLGAFAIALDYVNKLQATIVSFLLIWIITNIAGSISFKYLNN